MYPTDNRGNSVEKIRGPVAAKVIPFPAPFPAERLSDSRREQRREQSRRLSPAYLQYPARDSFWSDVRPTGRPASET